MWLDVPLVDHRDPIRVLEHDVRFREALGDVAALHVRRLADVDGFGRRRLRGLRHRDRGVGERLAGVGFGAGVGHRWRARLHRPERIDGRLQHLVLHLDEIERFFRDGGLVRGDRRDRLSRKDDTVDREDRVRARRRLALELGNVGRRQHGADAGQRARFAHVDPDYSCVRVRAAQQLGVEQAARRDIRHVLHAARDFLRPIRPRDRQPNTSHVARRLHHAHRDTPWCAASLIAATIFV